MPAWQRLLLGAVLVLTGAAAAVGANLVLLGVATTRDDPVGNLTPLAATYRSPVTITTTPGATVPTTTSPAPPEHDDEHDDD